MSSISTATTGNRRSALYLFLQRVDERGLCEHWHDSSAEPRRCGASQGVDQQGTPRTKGSSERLVERGQRSRPSGVFPGKSPRRRSSGCAASEPAGPSRAQGGIPVTDRTVHAAAGSRGRSKCVALLRSVRASKAALLSPLKHRTPPRPRLPLRLNCAALPAVAQPMGAADQSILC